MRLNELVFVRLIFPFRKVLSFLFILFSPHLLSAQISEKLYRQLPDSVKPENRLDPSLKEIGAILNHSSEINEKFDKELTLLCSAWGSKYNNIQDEKSRVNYVYAIAVFWYNNSQKPDSASKYAKISVSEIEKSTKPHQLFGDVYWLSGRLRAFAEDYSGGFDDNQKALQFYKLTGQYDKIGKAYTGMIYIFQLLKLYDKTIMYADSALYQYLNYQDSKKKKAQTAYTMILKGDAYTFKYALSKKRQFSDSAYKTIRQVIDNKSATKKNVIVAYSLLSQLNYYLKHYNASIAYADTAFQIRTHNPEIKDETLPNIRSAFKGLSLLELGKVSEATRILKKINIDPNDHFSGILLNHLYEYEKRRGNNSKALKYLEQLREFDKRYQLVQSQAAVFETEQKYNVANRDLQIIKLTERQNRDAIIAAGFLLIVLISALFIINRHQVNEKRRKSLVSYIDELTETQILRLHETEIKAAEKERHKMGQQLHDDLASSIAGSIQYLRMKSIEEKDNEDKKRLIQVLNILEESYGKVRAKAHEFYYSETTGRFWESLEDYTGLFFAGTNMKVSVSHEVSGISVSSEIKTTLLLALKEGIVNILKHAKASEVEILIYNDPGQLIMRISDNGIGFTDSYSKKSMGLKSLRHRIEKLEGQLVISSGETGGSSLEITFPVE